MQFHSRMQCTHNKKLSRLRWLEADPSNCSISDNTFLEIIGKQMLSVFQLKYVPRNQRLKGIFLPTPHHPSVVDIFVKPIPREDKCDIHWHISVEWWFYLKVLKRTCHLCCYSPGVSISRNSIGQYQTCSQPPHQYAVAIIFAVAIDDRDVIFVKRWLEWENIAR